MQQALKPVSRTAGARILPAELFREFDLAALDEAAPAPDARLAGEALTPLAHGLSLGSKRRGRLRDACGTWVPPVLRGRWAAEAGAGGQRSPATPSPRAAQAAMSHIPLLIAGYATPSVVSQFRLVALLLAPLLRRRRNSGSNSQTAHQDQEPD
jgi:hypothetical protein